MPLKPRMCLGLAVLEVWTLCILVMRVTFGFMLKFMSTGFAFNSDFKSLFWSRLLQLLLAE